MASSCGDSYTSSQETTNFVRICRIVLDVLRDILFQLLTLEILPADLPNKVQNNQNKLGNLNSKINTWLCGISPPSTEIPSAEKFDVSSLYTLIRNLCSQVPAPSTQWGQIPSDGDITLGDDIERVRVFRNTFYGHATQSKLETPEFNKLCIDIKDVVGRFDAYFFSLGKPMKCNFVCAIDIILKDSMDQNLQDHYIDKMKQIWSDDLVDVKHEVGDLKKTVETSSVELKKDMKENAEETRIRLMRIEEYCEKASKEKCKNEKDRREGMNDSLVDVNQDTEKEKSMNENTAFEMPPGMDLKICIIKCYAGLRCELSRKTVMDIAKDLFKKSKHKDLLEEIAKADNRRLCVDKLLKRVLKLEANGLKIFFDSLCRSCIEEAKKLVEIKVTDMDRRNFTQVSESVRKVSHRIPSGLKFHQPDVDFFQCQLHDTPETVDEIADVLLSQFKIRIIEHSQLMRINDPMEKIKALLDNIQSCQFDSHSEIESVLESELYKKWQEFKAGDSTQGLENQSIWQYLQEKLQSFKQYLIRHFRALGICFRESMVSSLVLKFVALDNFDVKLLKPEAVKTKVLEMIKTVCPGYQDIFKEPVHLAVFFKPSSDKDKAEVHFFLETSEEKKECSCARLGSHDIHYMAEEMDPASLSNWMINKGQLKKDTKSKLVDLISLKGMPRRKKMRELLSIAESLGNGYELLRKYCEEHDTFVYNKVFKKHRQMMAEENPDSAQWDEFSCANEEGLQRLFCTWIDFTVDPKVFNKDVWFVMIVIIAMVVHKNFALIFTKQILAHICFAGGLAGCLAGLAGAGNIGAIIAVGTAGGGLAPIGLVGLASLEGLAHIVLALFGGSLEHIGADLAPLPLVSLVVIGGIVGFDVGSCIGVMTWLKNRNMYPRVFPATDSPRQQAN